jgi:hypothetical protein
MADPLAAILKELRLMKKEMAATGSDQKHKNSQIHMFMYIKALYVQVPDYIL